MLNTLINSSFTNGYKATEQSVKKMDLSKLKTVDELKKNEPSKPLAKVEQLKEQEKKEPSKDESWKTILTNSIKNLTALALDDSGAKRKLTLDDIDTLRYIKKTCVNDYKRLLVELPPSVVKELSETAKDLVDMSTNVAYTNKTFDTIPKGSCCSVVGRCITDEIGKLQSKKAFTTVLAPKSESDAKAEENWKGLVRASITNLASTAGAKKDLTEQDIDTLRFVKDKCVNDYKRLIAALPAERIRDLMSRASDLVDFSKNVKSINKVFDTVPKGACCTVVGQCITREINALQQRKTFSVNLDIR